MLNKFVDLVEDEIGLCRSLLSVLQKEKQAVVGSELTALNETSKAKENLLLKIRILEEERLRMLEKLADSLGYPTQDLTLSKLPQLVEEPHSTRLMECYSNLSALTQSIQDVNNINKALLKHSLELVRGSLTFLDNLLAANPVYYPTGKIQSSGQSGMVFSGRI
jgi:flagellar biosynthesis/type III secretory pathway chaperone